MKRGNSKSEDTSAQPKDAKRIKTTRAQELRAAESRRQIAQRNAERKGVAAVPTFSRTKTQTSATSSNSHTGFKTKPLTPIRSYNLRQGTSPPTRYHAGSKSTSLAHNSNLADRMKIALAPGAVEQTGLMQSLADQVASMKELLQQNLANGASAALTQQQLQSLSGEMDPASQETTQRLRKQLDDVSDQLSEVRRKLADKEFELETAQKTQRTLEMERDELLVKISTKTEEVARVNSEMSALRAATADIDSRLASSQARCELQESTIKELRETIAEREKTIAEMREKLMDDEIQRRKLHNTIQDLKGNIRVFCRIRPSQRKEAGGEQLYVLDPSDARKLDVVEAGTSATGKKQQTKHAFTYDHVFGPGCSQEDVFEELAMFVQSVLDGYSCCVFAYGQTGSGKTYTMEGPSSDSVGSDEVEIKEGSPNRGVIPRTVELLFTSMHELELRGWKYNIEVRFLEVYNEQVRDLLAGKGGGAAGGSVKIQHESNGKTTVTGCKTVPVTTPAAVYALIKTARAARAVAATRYNDYSSRSHSVFQLYLHGQNEQRHEIVESVLNLVDLAGSERLSATMPGDDGSSSLSASASVRQKETLNINLSLMNLRKVITALAAKQAHIPYRESVLTQLLQNALGGECKMLMFVNVSPELANVSQSLSSLRFASTANKCVTGVVQRHAQKGVTQMK